MNIPIYHSNGDEQITTKLIELARKRYERMESPFSMYYAPTKEEAQQFTYETGIKISVWPIYTIFRTPYGQILLSVGDNYYE